MSTLTQQEVQDIADLAKLQLSEEEATMYAEQLSGVLDYFRMLEEVDTEDTPETCQVTGLEDVAREDVAIPSSEEKRKKLIEQFPDRVGNVLKVKAVFEE